MYGMLQISGYRTDFVRLHEKKQLLFTPTKEHRMATVGGRHPR